jgi:uncharacterized protein (DUF952 family)
MSVILHIADGAAWGAALASGRYLPSDYRRDGFVHCSDPDQVVRVANQRFRGVGNLVLLYIDPSRLSARVYYENAEGDEELFPHVYGPIEVAAVSRWVPFREGPDGFELPR